MSIGDALIDFINKCLGEPVYLVGHSSGGLLAAYVAGHSTLCKGLILEDPPLFSSQGERRFKTFNYLDLSTVCHEYIESKIQEDFVLYYFENQRMWKFFPDKSRDKIKMNLLKLARRYRKKHPNLPLKVPFFPKSALAAYHGMNEYDPYFGESFYNDSFHAGITHQELLQMITCKTLLMKAKTNIDDDHVLLAAMSDKDAALASSLLTHHEILRIDCGHGIHIERMNDFTNAIISFANESVKEEF